MENTLGLTQNTKYIRFQIIERKYSSNIIKGFYMTKNKEGKDIEKDDIVLMTGLNKSEGDIIINNTFNLLYK